MPIGTRHPNPMDPGPIKSPEELAGKYRPADPSRMGQARQMGQSYAAANPEPLPSPGLMSSLGISGGNQRAIANNFGPKPGVQVAGGAPPRIGMQAAAPSPASNIGMQARVGPPKPWGQKFDPANFSKGVTAFNTSGRQMGQRVGVQGPAMAGNVGAQGDERSALVAASQAANARYGPALARASGIEAGIGYDDRMASRQMDQQRLAMQQSEQIPMGARLQIGAMQAGMSPPEAKAQVAQWMQGQGPTIGVPAQQVAGNIGVPAQQDPDVTLRNSPTGVFPAFQSATAPGNNAQDALSAIAASGVDLGSAPAEASAIGKLLTAKYGKDAMSVDVPQAPTDDLRALPPWRRRLENFASVGLGGEYSLMDDPVERYDQAMASARLAAQLSGQPAPYNPGSVPMPKRGYGEMATDFWNWMTVSPPRSIPETANQPSSRVPF